MMSFIQSQQSQQCEQPKEGVDVKESSKRSRSRSPPKDVGSGQGEGEPSTKKVCVRPAAAGQEVPAVLQNKEQEPFAVFEVQIDGVPTIIEISDKPLPPQDAEDKDAVPSESAAPPQKPEEAAASKAESKEARCMGCVVAKEAARVGARASPAEVEATKCHLCRAEPVAADLHEQDSQSPSKSQALAESGRDSPNQEPEEGAKASVSSTKENEPNSGHVEVSAS